MTKIKKAIFPVGGLGTRFLPVTKALPKEMLPVASKPLIQYAFEEAVNAGIEEFIFITGRNKNVINNHFDCVYELEKFLDEKEKHDALQITRDWVPTPGKIAFIRQQQPLGLGHAIWCARHFVQDEPVAVLLADELFRSTRSPSLLSEMVELYHKTNANIIAVADVAPNQTSNYGIIKPAEDDGTQVQIVDMVEKPSPELAPSNTSIVGRYIIHPEIFDLLERTPKGSGGEIQLTDALRANLATRQTIGYRFSGKRYDCGNHLGFFQANVEFAINDPLMGKQAREILKTIVKDMI